MPPSCECESLREQIDALSARAEAAETREAGLREALAACERLLETPDNGVHYCRYCDAGTHNQWHHAHSCWFERRKTEIVAARNAARAALADAPNTAKGNDRGE